jgi:curli biogenesis system outer membrane secretion channel CsgG
MLTGIIAATILFSSSMTTISQDSSSQKPKEKQINIAISRFRMAEQPTTLQPFLIPEMVDMFPNSLEAELLTKISRETVHFLSRNQVEKIIKESKIDEILSSGKQPENAEREKLAADYLVLGDIGVFGLEDVPEGKRNIANSSETKLNITASIKVVDLNSWETIFSQTIQESKRVREVRRLTGEVISTEPVNAISYAIKNWSTSAARGIASIFWNETTAVIKDEDEIAIPLGKPSGIKVGDVLYVFTKEKIEGLDEPENRSLCKAVVRRVQEKSSYLILENHKFDSGELKKLKIFVSKRPIE